MSKTDGQIELSLVSETIREIDIRPSELAPPRGLNFEQQIVMIKFCNLREGVQAFILWRPCRDGENSRPRKYLKVHHPIKCECLASGRTNVIINRPEEDTTYLASENIFRLLYFKRGDGSYRNALGQAAQDEKGENYGRKKTLLKDLVRTVGYGARKEPSYLPDVITSRTLLEMMEWPAEFFG